jgi:hypothetical protein
LKIIRDEANSDDESDTRKEMMRFRKIGLAELMKRRNSLSELEIMER